MGDKSGPAHGQAVAAGHHAGRAGRYSEAGRVRAAMDALHPTLWFTVS